VLRHLLDPRGLAAGRALLGASMLGRPTLVSGWLGVDRVTAERVGGLVQMLGAREVALGAGALTSRGDRRRWLAGGLLSDAVDAVVVAAAAGRGHVRPGAAAVLVAVAAAAAGLQAEALRRD
jgi:hypothetical protein